MGVRSPATAFLVFGVFRTRNGTVSASSYVHQSTFPVTIKIKAVTGSVKDCIKMSEVHSSLALPDKLNISVHMKYYWAFTNVR